MAIRVGVSARVTYKAVCGAIRQARSMRFDDRARAMEDVRDACLGVCPEIYEAAWRSSLLGGAPDGWGRSARSRVRKWRFGVRWVELRYWG